MIHQSASIIGKPSCTPLLVYVDAKTSAHGSVYSNILTPENTRERERDNMKTVPLPLSSSHAVVAYGSGYSPKSQQLLAFRTFTILAFATRSLSKSSSFTKINFLTGNCSLFTRMERFWAGTSVNKNKGMVESLQRCGIIQSKKVAEVMEKIDRALFVPPGIPAYVDNPVPIGYNATISAPHMHATCLQLLENNLQPGMRALDVGSGTGYLTACFALMVGQQGRAVGVEHIPELVELSINNIQKSEAAPLLKDGSLSVHVGDGRQGWPEFAPYDAIHVGAAAPDIPKPLIDQLKPGGRMVIPVGNIFQDLQIVEKNLDGSLTVRSETSVRYVPLTSRENQLRDY